ncbi:MAG: TrbI/VirB10 family protein [Pseudomonadota bacterium]|nr:TrbI/VirB10 family protein [Pseudomonadota bacterium]
MEVTKNQNWFSRIFFKEAKPFIAKQDINWRRISHAGVVSVVVLVVVLLLLPESKLLTADFHEKADIGSVGASKSIEGDPTNDALAQLEQSQMNARSVPSSKDYLGQSSGSGASSSGPDRSSSMIIARSGVDGKTQLPAGTRLSIKLAHKIIVSNQAMPIIGIVTKEVVHEDSVAIPQEAKIFGEASFDDSSDRAQVSWKSVQFPDGRERQLSAVGISADGQGGVEGKTHSEALKNTVGLTLTKFIGAYAEGSIQRGPFGANAGGDGNGMRNAVAETAKDRADSWAHDLQKEKKWIVLEAGNESLAVLSTAFVFRDPGAYGR